MKKLNLLLFLSFCFLILSCGGNKRAANVEFPITVDVSQDYPKEEVRLNEIAELKYISLETTDSSLISDYASVIYAGPDFVILQPDGRNNADILIFDGSGKIKSKVHYFGQGPDEISYYPSYYYNKEEQALYIFSSRLKKGLVFNLDGTLKGHYDEHVFASDALANFDGRWFFYDTSNVGLFKLQGSMEGLDMGSLKKRTDGGGGTSFALKELDPVTYLEKDSVNMFFSDRMLTSIMLIGDGAISIRKYAVNYLLYHKEGIVVNEPFADTVFLVNKKMERLPLIVRTPSIKNEKRERILSMDRITPSYLYMGTSDISGEKPFMYEKNVSLMYDFANKKMIQPEYVLDDFEGYKSNLSVGSPYSSGEYCWTMLQSFDLMDALEEGKLSGPLKTVAEGLKNEDNPVLLLMKMK